MRAPGARAGDRALSAASRRYKGLDVAIEALALLRAEPRAGACACASSAPRTSRTAARCASRPGALGVAEAIEWLGADDPDGVAAALARAHALLVPSVWEEPFPLVTIEGAFARVPLVAADVGGDRRGHARRGARAAVSGV